MEDKIIRCIREDQIAIVEAISNPKGRNEYMRESLEIAHRLLGDTERLRPAE